MDQKRAIRSNVSRSSNSSSSRFRSDGVAVSVSQCWNTKLTHLHSVSAWSPLRRMTSSVEMMNAVENASDDEGTSATDVSRKGSAGWAVIASRRSNRQLQRTRRR